MFRCANTLPLTTSVLINISTYYCKVHLPTFKKHVFNSCSIDLFSCANTLFIPTSWPTYYCKRTQFVHLLTFKKHVSNSCSFDLFSCANTLFILPSHVRRPDQHLTVNTYAFQSDTFTDIKRTFFSDLFFQLQKQEKSTFNL